MSAPARRRSPTSSIASALLLVVVAVALACVAAAANGVQPRIEMSDSMRPLVRAGDVLWIDEIRASSAARGDVVAFADPERGTTVLHRVVTVRRAANRLAFVTRGDANTGVERWTIARGGRLGRYTGVRLPEAGRVAVRLQGPPLAAIAGLSGLLLAGLVLRRIWR